MADKRIADFATLEEAQDDDLLLVSSEDETYNMKFRAIRGYLQTLTGFVKDTRTINGKALNKDIELQAPDITYQGTVGGSEVHTVDTALRLSGNRCHPLSSPKGEVSHREKERNGSPAAGIGKQRGCAGYSDPRDG